MQYELERKTAIEAVTQACQLCSGVQHRLSDEHKLVKSDASPVTVADFGSQALIVSHVRRVFPYDPIVGEEDASVLRQDDQTPLRNHVITLINAFDNSLTEADVLDAIDEGAKPCDFTERYWTLDPIDGTKGFLRGEQYAVALALVENGKPVVGVLGCPNLPVDEREPAKGRGVLFIAEKGRGTSMRSLAAKEEVSVHVAQTSNPADARFCDSVEAAHTSHDKHTKIAKLLGITAPSYRIDSQCKYAVVARGDASIYLRLTKANYLSWIWDHAAGAIVVQEAGGTVTDIFGQALEFSLGRKLSQNSGVVATNGLLHNTVIEAIQHLR
ncbi:3'(2'),5'-bisphosphate nucleotidase [candidate division KSB3 bacterium]|uniref:3'(2'),5'-bisphosphate nucleotidase n=1 Tax=candidate division KSB3 bacterium TaxID=2044937 RepID=A0A2G6KIJ4_9BACT|nr:MAG: 3'(2'),5'-bisphosphate nucleotidase [candidate division KSB3 bacterium]